MLFAFAGIFDRWINPESKEIIESFAIITTFANSMLQSIGVKRMPAILSRSNESQWIKPSNHLSDVLRLLIPYPAEKMNAYPVSERINVEGLNEPSMLNPVGEKLIIETNPVLLPVGIIIKKNLSQMSLGLRKIQTHKILNNKVIIYLLSHLVLCQ